MVDVENRCREEYFRRFDARTRGENSMYSY